MQSYGDSGDYSMNGQEQLRQECNALLQKVDFKQQVNRQWIAKCYRKLNSIINQNSKVNFNLTASSQNLPNLVTKYAFEIKPYNFSQGLQNYSKTFQESHAGKRKCQQPLIYRSVAGKWETIRLDRGFGQIRENNRFTIRIQAEQNSTIIVTYQNNHPLRIQPDKRIHYFEKATIEITPPSIISIVVTKEQSYTFDTAQGVSRTQVLPFKLPSNLIRLQIRKSSHGEGQYNFIRGLGDEYMIRPEETFDHGLSSSQGSNWPGYVGIQTESRSRD